jgi:maltose alpha-D-glucosyltransferase/alpha-amylase
MSTEKQANPHDWYKDAIIYQTHIKAYCDSNGDGIGDFAGLATKLDYIQSLGVDTIWLLPFYPSPLRDDGYDIASYETINPAYGTMEEFQNFVDEAHSRGLKVVTELVINHTSDQHEWFQRARRAPKGSSERDFYVWSDDDQKWMDKTRIIFNDTERSNWTWDEEAQQYFWHRFYSHQPDLNFDHPPVMEEVLRIMRMWLDTGVDGLRLDAIPYLVERDGTNNENLPETHDVLKRVRAEMDKHYPDRMLLAEANQWPEDTRPYFGDNDECHMGFHFPLMPRMYMALAQEDRHPITDILRQTPDIPEDCQWAIFLRNHDELTLEMVTDSERDYMWNYYASDRRARINMGIRRRLAPLMGNDRRKIELMNAMLFAMPGTPVIYYGDEIGMGDNYYLGDRDGVRTPMQWSGDRNGGFSRANPQQLYLPAIQDPVYGFDAVNVEAQSSQSSSLLNWMKNQIAIRRRQKAFGRGEMDILYPRNRKVLACIRHLPGENGEPDENVLCVFNISRSAQAVELDLSKYRTSVPVELSSGNAFPPIGDLPYLLTLPPFGFYWFSISADGDMPEWHVPATEVMPEFLTLTLDEASTSSALTGANKDVLQSQVLTEFLPLQRWFAGKDGQISSVEIAAGPTVENDVVLSTVTVHLDDHEPQTYLLPLGSKWGDEFLQAGATTLPATLSKLRRTNRVGALIDGAQDPEFAQTLISMMRSGDTPSGLTAATHGTFPDLTDQNPRPLGAEQSNMSIAFGDKAVIKIYRRLRAGIQPEIEMARFLTEAGFKNTPALRGEVSMETSGEEAVVAACFDFVPNQGDGWTSIVDSLVNHIEDEALHQAGGREGDASSDHPAEDMSAEDIAALGSGEDVEKTVSHQFPYPLDLSENLGRRTAEMHIALASETDNEAFGSAPVTQDDIARWIDDAGTQKANAVELLRGLKLKNMTEANAAAVQELLSRESEIDDLIAQVSSHGPSGSRSRIHGDYHLGQILVVQGDIQIIDFEGEPLRTIEERRSHASPWRDVAGMLRSFDYAAYAAIDRLTKRNVSPELATDMAQNWRDGARHAFLNAYGNQMGTEAENPHLALLELTKALYEVAYEVSNRPAWVSIPVNGVLALLDARK